MNEEIIDLDNPLADADFEKTESKLYESMMEDD